MFWADSLMQMDFMQNQTTMKDMDKRVREKKILKDELKALKNKQRDDSSVGSIKHDEERKR